MKWVRWDKYNWCLGEDDASTDQHFTCYVHLRRYPSTVFHNESFTVEIRETTREITGEQFVWMKDNPDIVYMESLL